MHVQTSQGESSFERDKLKKLGNHCQPDRSKPFVHAHRPMTHDNQNQRRLIICSYQPVASKLVPKTTFTQEASSVWHLCVTPFSNTFTFAPSSVKRLFHFVR